MDLQGYLKSLQKKVTDFGNSIPQNVGNALKNTANYFNPSAGVVQQPLKYPVANAPAQIPQVRSFWTDIPQVNPQNIVNSITPTWNKFGSEVVRSSPFGPGAKVLNNMWNNSPVSSSPVGQVASGIVKNLWETPATVAEGASRATMGTLNGNPQQVLGGLGQFGSGILNVLPMGGAKNAMPILEQFGKQAVVQGVKKGAVSTAKFMGAYGLLSGLHENENKPLSEQLVGAAKNGLLNAGLGLVTGGLAGGAGSAIGQWLKNKPSEINLGIGNLRKGETPEAVAIHTAQYVRNKLGQFAPSWAKETPQEIAYVRDHQLHPLTPAETKALDMHYGWITESQPGMSIKTLTPEEGQAVRKLSGQSPLDPGVTLPKDTILPQQLPVEQKSLVSNPLNSMPPVTKIVGQSPISQSMLQKQLESALPPKESSFDSIISTVANKANKIYTETLDRFHPLSVIAKKGGEDVAMRRALTGHYGAGSTANYHTEFQLAPILKESNVNDLRTASIALRDIELAQRGIKGSNIVDDILVNGKLPGGQQTKQTAEATARLAQLRQKLGPEGMTKLGNTLKQLYTYQDNLVKEYLVNTGVMSEAQFKAMKAENQFYVPFKRVMDKVDEYLGVPSKGPGSVSNNTIFKIKGSDKQIVDPIESIVENTYKIVGLGKRQEVAKTLTSLKSKLPEGMISKVGSSGNDTVSVFENGKKVFYKVPQEVAGAAKGMNQDQMSTIVNILAAPTKVFRATATGINPEFMGPNVVRDLQSAFVNVGLNPLKWVSGLAHMMKRDEVYQQFLKSGGLTSRVSLDRPFLTKTVSELSGQSTGLRVTDPRRIYSLLERLGQYSEQPTRIASFEKTLGKTGNLADAAYAAQEGTVNFARRGSKTQSINAIYAFLNARAQGTDRLIRTIKNDPVGASVRLGMITAAPAVGLYFYNRNFNSYNDPRVVPDYEKQNNFIIMLSDQPIKELGGAQYIKIPKGDVGKLANPIESFMSYADGKGGDIQKSLFDSLGAFAPISNVGDLIPTALRPAIENAANYNYFYNKPIVPESKLNYPAAYQTSKGTPAIYKEIGARLNVSPNMVENLLRGYLTGFARMGEMATSPFSKQDNYSGQDVNQTPLVRRFLGGAVRTEEEQQLNDVFKQKGILNKIQDIKTGVKYGNIPVDVGINEINKLLEQPTQPTTNPSYLGPKNVGANENAPYSQGDALKKQMEIAKVQMQVQTTGKPQEFGGRVYSINPDTGGVESYSLSKQKNDEINATYEDTADQLKSSDDYGGWVDATQKYVDYLKEYKKTLTAPDETDDVTRLNKKIRGLEEDISKYKSYGGFKKPKKPAKITIKSPQKISVKFPSLGTGLRPPQLTAFKISKSPRATKSVVTKIKQPKKISVRLAKKSIIA